MKIKKGFIKRKAVDKWVVMYVGSGDFNPDTVIELNETASDIWDCIMRGFSVDETADFFVKEYGISKELATDVITEFIGTLEKNGILE